MDADTFINIVLEKIESLDKSGVCLADKLRESYNFAHGTLDGFLVNEMTKVIEEIIDKTPEDEFRCAWNEIAEKEGYDPLQKGDILGGSYSEMFIEEILDAILFSE